MEPIPGVQAEEDKSTARSMIRKRSRSQSDAGRATSPSAGGETSEANSKRRKLSNTGGEGEYRRSSDDEDKKDGDGRFLRPSHGRSDGSEYPGGESDKREAGEFKQVSKTREEEVLAAGKGKDPERTTQYIEEDPVSTLENGTPRDRGGGAAAAGREKEPERTTQYIESDPAPTLKNGTPKDRGEEAAAAGEKKEPENGTEDVKEDLSPTLEADVENVEEASSPSLWTDAENAEDPTFTTDIDIEGFEEDHTPTLESSVPRTRMREAQAAGREKELKRRAKATVEDPTPILEIDTPSTGDVSLKHSGRCQLFQTVQVPGDGNCFWAAFSTVYHNDAARWAEVKLQTKKYFMSVLMNPAHPRHTLYQGLDDLAAASGGPSLIRQLQDFNAWTSDEMTQVVADLFDVELVTHWVQSSTDGRRPFQGYNFRGAHNRQQLFLSLNHNHWQGMRPSGVRPGDFRWELHAREWDSRTPKALGLPHLELPFALVPRPRLPMVNMEEERLLIRKSRAW